MATYGDFPGVKITTVGGGIAGVQVGDQEKLFVVGVGDPSVENAAPVEEPTTINSRRDADRKFGTDTELSDAVKDALGNGANMDYVYGVMLDVVSGNTESFAGTATGVLSNVPHEYGSFSAQDTVAAGSVTVNKVYESPPSAPSEGINLNPNTGEFTAASSSDYDITYDYPQYENAFDSIDVDILENETAIIAAIDESENVAAQLSSAVTSLRRNFKFAQGVTGAEPNSTAEDGTPRIDAAAYDDQIDSDAMYLAGPSRLEYRDRNAIGGLSGLMAGHGIIEPIYNDSLNAFAGLEQRISSTDAGQLRQKQVMPLQQQGSIRVKDNTSTSTETDWERDFWRRRIVDRVIILAKQVGDSTVGRINNEDNRQLLKEMLEIQLEFMVDDSLLEPNTEDETKWFVDVYQMSSDQVGVDIGITPEGIIKRVEVTITVNT